MNIVKAIKPFVTKYKPELLISLGISGFVITSILSVKSTVKSVKDIDAEKKRLDRDLTKKEVLKLCWKNYIPPVITAGLSIPSIIVGNNVTNKRNAALAAAYTVAETSLQTFKEETAKTMTEEKFKELEEKVAQRKVEETAPKSSANVLVCGGDETLFYEEYSKRYFKSDWNTLQKIVNELNASAMAGRDTITLSDWYGEIGLDSIMNSDNIGWSVYNGPRSMLEISLDSCITPDNKPCAVIRYVNEPKVLY